MVSIKSEIACIALIVMPGIQLSFQQMSNGIISILTIEIFPFNQDLD